MTLENCLIFPAFCNPFTYIRQFLHHSNKFTSVLEFLVLLPHNFIPLRRAYPTVFFGCIIALTSPFSPLIYSYLLLLRIYLSVSSNCLVFQLILPCVDSNALHTFHSPVNLIITSLPHFKGGNGLLAILHSERFFNLVP